MAEDDYGYEDGDVDEDFDQIEYRPPAAKPPPAQQADGAGNPYVAAHGNGAAGQKRGRDGGNEHHLDVTTPDVPKADTLDQDGKDGYYDDYNVNPASKRAASGTPGYQHPVPSSYEYNAGTGGGTNVDGAYGGPADAGNGNGNGGNNPSPPDSAPRCQCGEACIRRVSTTGKNPGRAFFKCPKMQGEQCGYFKWEDELGAGAGGGAGGAPSQASRGAYGATGGGSHNPYVANPYSQAASSSGAGPNPYTGSGAYGGGGTGAYGGGTGAYGGGDAADAAGGAGGPGPGGEEYVKCMCGVDCPVKTSNSANNPGRQFFACPKMRDDPTRCRFFQWADEVGNGGGGGSGAGVLGGGGGGGAVGTCYVCNQPGHFASSCPQRAAGGGAGGGGGGFGGRSSFGAAGGSGGGGAAGGAPCYICNQTGHWARDCPNKQGGGGSYGGGGYSGRGGGGPPQSFASRFGREGGGAGGGGGGYGGGGGAHGGGGGGGGKGNCYKCGQPGHWASSCPNAR